MTSSKTRGLYELTSDQLRKTIVNARQMRLFCAPAFGNSGRGRQIRFQATANQAEEIQTDSALRSFAFADHLGVGRGKSGCQELFGPGR